MLQLWTEKNNMHYTQDALQGKVHDSQHQTRKDHHGSEWKSIEFEKSTCVIAFVYGLWIIGAQHCIRIRWEFVNTTYITAIDGTQSSMFSKSIRSLALSCSPTTVNYCMKWNRTECNAFGTTSGRMRDCKYAVDDAIAGVRPQHISLFHRFFFKHPPIDYSSTQITHY